MGGIIIRKVELRMNEQAKYEVIKYLVDHPEASKERASLKLNCTIRHVNRMIAGYKKKGKAFFIHGNRGRKPANTVDKATRPPSPHSTATSTMMRTSRTLRSFWQEMKG